MSTLADAADVNPVIKFLSYTLQHLAVDSSAIDRQMLEIPEGLMNYPV
jgi:hypothetical protein